MVEEFKVLDYLLGRELKDEFKEMADNSPHGVRTLLTRPDDLGSSIHINMYLIFDKQYRLSEIKGDKCFSVYRGMYNRSSKVHHRSFSKKDVRYLEKYILSITKNMEA